PVAGTPPQVKVENISKQTLSYRLEWSTNMVNWVAAPGVRTIDAYSTQWIMPGVGDYSPLFFRVIQQ
ncbi:hypothetical protein, partial [Streptococcus pneumoniae]|uniref:hypothetical protein n=1 Tax=Streptococcus pneumoniae TaxID=1313 RepID=UPI0018B0BBBB